MKPLHLFLIFVLTALFSVNANASNFAALGVILGGVLVTMVNISLSIWACTVAKKGGHTKALPILAVIGFLMFFAIGMVNGEANHLAKSDASGMINIILWPGILSLLVPFFIRKTRS